MYAPPGSCSGGLNPASLPLRKQSSRHQNKRRHALSIYQLVMGEDGKPVELGRGAMGVTYKAVDVDLHCPVLELASSMPDQVGMSVAFSYDIEEDKELSYPAVRCVEIFSCDLVDSPAANAGGLFSKPMSDETKTPETPAAAGEPTLESRLAAVEAALASIINNLPI
jgi:hypothetical protein